MAILSSACSQAQKESNTKNTEEQSGRQLTYERSVSFLDTDEDTLTTIDVAIADNNKERNQGLMDVRELPSDKGMLFIFDENQPRSFWMANTPLSLDIMFVNENYEIVRIHHSAQPFSEKSFKSEEPAKYVIETNGGFAVSHDIQEGAKVSF
ncbi:DUF192 domain-containing protein [Fodinibius sp.]|uniref:DUF192 domain-containing protein n=1 Tax=Fodinibius sp. TaxID=1872440 RepID=UPI002ACD4F59|nr:DUF192 domain-containing protein [Fodinibius sp.]MDZ7659187.1 DUF192 domain-containing protein [Fodinibius sp.]